MSAPELDYHQMTAEIRRDLRDAKIGLAQWLVVEVISDYSFAVGQAAAWLPSLEVFCLRTAMAKKEVGDALARLESYGVLEWEAAPQADHPHARRYKLYPRSRRAWSIAPRVPDRRLQERAAIMDRWLRALNASGGPAQSDLFPPKWDHADTLTEWQASQQSGSPNANQDRDVNGPLGKNPTRGEKPHAPLNGGIGLNERDLSLNPLQTIECGAVGKNPTSIDAEDPEDELRPEHWPTRAVENRLMRRIGELMRAFYPAEIAEANMVKYGGIWRWRIRNWSFAVEQTLFKAEAEWPEIRKLGGWLTREWTKIWRQRGKLQTASIEARSGGEPSAEGDLETEEMIKRILTSQNS